MGHAPASTRGRAPWAPHRRGPRVRERALCIALGCLWIATQAGEARASEPLLTVLKATLLGSMTGLVLGATLTLVVDEDSRSDTVRWGTVIGTFVGCGVGIWQAAAGSDDLFSAAAPPAARAYAAEPTVHESGPLAGSEGPGTSRGWGMRLSLLHWRW